MSRLIVVLMLFPAWLFAQDNTLGKTPEIKKETPKGEILIVPNNTTMYRSDCDRELAAANNLSVPAVREMLRRKLAEHVWLKAKESGTVVLLHPADPTTYSDLQYVYTSIAYKAQPLRRTETQSESKGIDRIFSSSSRETQSRPGTAITKGELTVAQQEEKYMETTVVVPSLLPNLTKQFGSEIFLFIGELDLLMAPGTRQEDIQRDSYQREIRVHYTLMDAGGEIVFSGVATCLLPGKMYDVEKISSRCFPALATEIASKLQGKKQH